MSLSTAATKPAHADDLILSNLARVMVTSEGTLDREEDLCMNGWPGIDATISTKDGKRARARIYALGKVVFMSMTVCERLTGDSDEFLKSMAMPKTAGKGPLKVAGPVMKTYVLPGAHASLLLPNPPTREVRSTAMGPIKVRQAFKFAARYCDRRYICTYVDVRPEDMKNFIPLNKALLRLHDEFVADGSDRKDVFFKRGSDVCLRTTAKISLGDNFRVESFLRGRRLYSIGAITPNGPNRDKEVSSILSSIHLTK